MGCPAALRDPRAQPDRRMGAAEGVSDGVSDRRLKATALQLTRFPEGRTPSPVAAFGAGLRGVLPGGPSPALRTGGGGRLLNRWLPGECLMSTAPCIPCVQSAFS